MTIDITDDELELIIEALKARASRHESMSRAARNSIAATMHARDGTAMRKLARKLEAADALQA